MNQLALTGTLEGLEVLTFDHFPRFSAAVERGQQLGFAYYFPYLISRARQNRSVVLVSEEQGCMCVFVLRQRDGKAHLDLAVAPTPLDPQVLGRCLARANDFNGDRSARVLRVDEKDVPAASEVPGLRLKGRKSQYLYSPREFSNLGGGRFRTLRRNVARVQEMPNLEVRDYSPEHEEECRDLLRRWRKHHRDTHGTAGGFKTAARAIEMAKALSAPLLHGEVVLLDGKLVAFAFGGEIRPGLGCFFEAKSEVGIPGLSYFQRYSFLSKLTSFDLVNDGSDVGRPGLKQLKESLRPAATHLEYRGTQRVRRQRRDI
ncbi:MAG: phosphatidylglycerol lysyltransferase domain-containing protein [Planctomycetota bacterium]